MTEGGGPVTWPIDNGVLSSSKGMIRTKRDDFTDYQLHVEFATPEKVTGKGQGRGNSGVFLADRYEVQILDSFNNTTYFDGQCAAIYKQSPPMVNACRKPGEWQTYDIIFESPRFAGDGKLTKPGYVTVIHNGAVVHNHFELQGGTSYDQPAHYDRHLGLQRLRGRRLEEPERGVAAVDAVAGGPAAATADHRLDHRHVAAARLGIGQRERDHATLAAAGGRDVLGHRTGQRAQDGVVDS